MIATTSRSGRMSSRAVETFLLEGAKSLGRAMALAWNPLSTEVAALMRSCSHRLT